MKTVKGIVLGAVVLLAAAACYWVPPEGGGLAITVQGKDLPAGYIGMFLRVELYAPGDARMDYNAGTDEWTPVITGAPIPIGGQPHFEQAIGGMTGYPSEPDFTVPDIPPGVYRLRLTIWDNISIDPWKYDYEGISDPFTVTGEGTVDVDVTLHYYYAYAY